MFFSGIQVLAAHRYGIKRVILPERNMKDLAEVPAPILSGLEVCIESFALCISTVRDALRP